MSLSFEDIYALTEIQIQALLKAGKYPSTDFITNRYIATIILAQNNYLKT